MHASNKVLDRSALKILKVTAVAHKTKRRGYVLYVASKLKSKGWYESEMD